MRSLQYLVGDQRTSWKSLMWRQWQRFLCQWFQCQWRIHTFISCPPADVEVGEADPADVVEVLDVLVVVQVRVGLVEDMEAVEDVEALEDVDVLEEEAVQRRQRLMSP